MRLRPARLDKLSRWCIKLERDALFEHGGGKLLVALGNEIMRL